MKKILLVTLALSIILSMSNCKEDTEDVDKKEEPITTNNPFIGTWRSTENGYHDVFTNDIVTVYRTDKSIFWKATYTYDDTFVTVKLDIALSDPKLVEEVGDTVLLPYIFNNDEYLLLNTVIFEKCNYNFTP